MRYAFSVSGPEELARYQAFLTRHQARIEQYIAYLQANFQVADLPKLIVLANHEMATQVHSQLPLPAYTNEIRMVLTPDLAVWKSIYLKQLDPYAPSATVDAIKAYYRDQLSENHILQLIGHELAHHSEWFMDEFDGEREEGIWFEEGMVEYISSHFFLTADELANARQVESALITLYEDAHSASSLETFGQSIYDCSPASIFYNYWRSSLAIERLVAELGSVEQVFAQYRAWFANGSDQTLAQWFGIESPCGRKGDAAE